MAIQFALEDFANPVETIAEPEQPEDLPGYAEGYAAAIETITASQTQLSQDTVQALSDITFGFAEARLHVMASLEPLFRTLVDTVLPETLPESFRAHVVALLTKAAKTDAAKPFELSLHPQQVAAVSNILPAALAPLLSLSGDPALSPHTAAIRQGDLETALDHDALLTEVSQALSALFDQITESKAHG